MKQTKVTIVRERKRKKERNKTCSIWKKITHYEKFNAIMYDIVVRKISATSLSLSIYLSFSLSLYFPLSLSFSLSLCLCLSLCLSISLCLSLSVSLYLSLCVYVSLSLSFLLILSPPLIYFSLLLSPSLSCISTTVKCGSNTTLLKDVSILRENVSNDSDSLSSTILISTHCRPE